MIDQIVSDVLNAKGNPADYLPNVVGWTRTAIDQPGSSGASASYSRPGAPTDVEPISVYATVYPSEERARVALAVVIGRYETPIGFCVTVPMVGCVVEDVQRRWFGFAFSRRTAVIEVRLISHADIPLTVLGGLSPRVRQLDAYLDPFVSAFAGQLP